MAIDNISNINSLVPSKSIFDTVDKKETDYSKIPFADYLNDALNNTNSLLLESEKVSSDFAAGRTDNMIQVMVSAEKADTAFQFTMQVRNKIMDAYSEIMRMQI